MFYDYPSPLHSLLPSHFLILPSPLSSSHFTPSFSLSSPLFPVPFLPPFSLCSSSPLFPLPLFLPPFLLHSISRLPFSCFSTLCSLYPHFLLSLLPLFLPSSHSSFSNIPSQFDDSVYLAVSQDEEDTEESLIRKLFVFNRIVTLLYGPVDSK